VEVIHAALAGFDPDQVAQECMGKSPQNCAGVSCAAVVPQFYQGAAGGVAGLFAIYACADVRI